MLNGSLCRFAEMKAIVIFAHGSGSSRHSPRNQMVASWMQREGFGTLLFDLLTREEDAYYENRFNIDLLTQRLICVTKWVHHQQGMGDIPVAYFGASTGAAAALNAAAQVPSIISVISRGGRPDLAMAQLEYVQAPTLLIVGGNDEEVIRLNQLALDKLTCEKQLEIVEGATHLFEEPGAMQQVCRLATQWLQNHLVSTIDD